MLRPDYSTNFKKDLKRIQKLGLNIDKLKNIMSRLSFEENLEPKHRDHLLIGNYVGYRECHVTPDLLLIYKVIDDEIIHFHRAGTHSQLFK